MKNTKQTDWIETKFKDSEIRRQILIQGRKVKVSVSPYDIPEAVRFSINADRTSATIEFRYISNDEDKKKVELEHVMFYVGKSSSRLYEIKFQTNSHVSDHSAAELQEEVAQLMRSIDALTEYEPQPLRKTNSELVKGAITSQASELQFA